MKEEIYNSRMRAGKRTFFFDVKIAANNQLYLDITESKKKDDTFERHNIMIFAEDIKKFKNEIFDIYEQFFKDKD